MNKTKFLKPLTHTLKGALYKWNNIKFVITPLLLPSSRILHQMNSLLISIGLVQKRNRMRSHLRAMGSKKKVIFHQHKIKNRYSSFRFKEGQEVFLQREKMTKVNRTNNNPNHLLLLETKIQREGINLLLQRLIL